MPAKALVVDDSRAMRSILAKILARLGFEVLQAADGLIGESHEWYRALSR